MTKQWVKLNVLTTMFTVIYLNTVTGERVAKNYSYHARIHINRVMEYVKKHEYIDTDMRIVGIDNYKQQTINYRMPIDKFIEVAETYSVSNAKDYLNSIYGVDEE